MITWSAKVNDRTSRMIGFDHHMRKVAELIETDDDWTLRIGNREFKLNGKGCQSPSDYIEAMIEPLPLTLYRNEFMPFFSFSTRSGTNWEVWGE